MYNSETGIVGVGMDDGLFAADGDDPGPGPGVEWYELVGLKVLGKDLCEDEDVSVLPLSVSLGMDEAFCLS